MTSSNSTRRAGSATAEPGTDPTRTRPDRASTLRVLGLAGSLRRGSYNRRLIQHAARSATSAVSVRLFDDLGSVPLFDEDLESRAAGDPPPVRRLKEAVLAAHGLLIATPEYNQSVPGVLKNAIDWLSRPYPAHALVGKPVAILGASTGRWGTRLAQTALRQTLTATECHVLPAPQIYLASAAELFDERGNLSDDRIARQVGELMGAFERWIERTAQETVHEL